MRWVCALLLALIAGGATAGEPLPEHLAYHVTRVTEEHRYDSTSPGLMSGHWGHHLGRLVRTDGTGLWFVDDSGTDVNVSPKTRFYHLDADSVWRLKAEIENPGTIQQNTAAVAVRDTVFAYGLNIAGPSIVELWLDTRTMDTGSRVIRWTVSNTNYIGAAVSPRGERVVWWSKVVDCDAPTKWYYSFYRDGAWSRNVASDVAANDFSYVIARFLNDTTFYAAGEAIGGCLPDWTYALGVGKVVLGKPIADWAIMPGENLTSNDIWYNERDGSVHLLGNARGGNMTYYHLPAGGAWPDSARIVSDPTSIWRGTRFLDSRDGNLYLVLSTPNGLKLKSVAKDAIDGPLDIDAMPTYDLYREPGFDRIFALYVECRTLQTSNVLGVNFAFPGNDYDSCRVVKHVDLHNVDWVDPVAPRSATPLRLQQNTPNPFNPRTNIRYSVPESGTVHLQIFDVTGRAVRTLVQGYRSAGEHMARWNGRDSSGRPAASGVYFYRLEAGAEAVTRRMVLVR